MAWNVGERASPKSSQLLTGCGNASGVCFYFDLPLLPGEILGVVPPHAHLESRPRRDLTPDLRKSGTERCLPDMGIWLNSLMKVRLHSNLTSAETELA